MGRCKRWLMVFLTGILLIAAGLIASMGKAPFRDLEAKEILSASVLLGPPDQTVDIQDLETLTALLRQLRIYRRDDSYTGYAGQTCLFTIQKKDGTRLQIAAFNPFVILDGQGYRCDYESCEALNRFANSLLSG